MVADPDRDALFVQDLAHVVGVDVAQGEGDRRAAVLGGFGNVAGTILAGLLVGLIESYTTQFLAPGLIDIVVFGLLLLMLAFRPAGLISERREENV